MDGFEISKKRIMHIDMSCKFYEKRDSGVAFKILKSGAHKGLVLSNKLKRELDRDIHAYEDYARLYAICIYTLIENNLDDFDILVVCGDEEFDDVKKYLDMIFRGNEIYQLKDIISIGELREITGKPKLRSFADRIANIYRRKARKPLYRRQNGISLNIVGLGHRQICEKWIQLIKKA